MAKGGGQNRRPWRATEAHRLVCQLASLQAPLTNRTPHKRPFPRPDVASGPPEQSACRTGGPWDEPPRNPEPSGNFTRSTLSVCSLVWPHTQLLLTASTKSCSVPFLTPGPALAQPSLRVPSGHAHWTQRMGAEEWEPADPHTRGKLSAPPQTLLAHSRLLTATQVQKRIFT